MGLYMRCFVRLHLKVLQLAALARLSSLPNIVDHVGRNVCVPAPLIIKPGQLEKDPDLHHEFLFKGSPLANKTKEVDLKQLI